LQGFDIADPSKGAVQFSYSTTVIAREISLHLSRDWMPVRRLIFFVCGCLFPVFCPAAITYYFDWYCPGCATLGSGSSGREGPFGSGSACEGSRSSKQGSMNARGCGPACFNPLPCRAEGSADTPRVTPISPRPGSSNAASTATPRLPESIVEPSRRRPLPGDAGLRPDTEGKPAPQGGVAGTWRNSFSRYEAEVSRDMIAISLVETCTNADCTRTTMPNRPVFRGKQEGKRLVGVVLIHTSVESEQNGRRCNMPAGEFPIEGELSGDGRRIVWGSARIPVAEGCAPVQLSLGTWMRA